MKSVGEFSRIPLATGIYLHHHRIPLYKTVRVDVCISEPLGPFRNSQMALIGRLLERGTRSLPDLQSLNRFIDDLYGAHYYAEIDRLGPYQFVHLCLELVDGRFLQPGSGDILGRGLEFLREILHNPAGDGTGFREDFLAQEKEMLTRLIVDQFNDKMAYAQHRCVEEMCRGSALALSSLGTEDDFTRITGASLMEFHRRLLATARIDIFLSGDVDRDEFATRLTDAFITWERKTESRSDLARLQASPGLGREIFEIQEVHQAKLVMGYRTPVHYGDPDYPALVLLNLILGGEGPSRLFKYLREEQGLCYFTGSHLEALNGLLFVLAGIESASYQRTRMSVDQQLDMLVQGRFAPGEIESAKRLLQAHLLGLEEEREGYFRYRFRQGLVGGDGAPEDLWQRSAQVEAGDLSRIARDLTLDTAYMLYGGAAVGGAV